MRHSWTFSTQKSKQRTSNKASSEARIVFWMFSISCPRIRKGSVLGVWFAHLALSGNVRHILVAQFRYKHTRDVTQFPATFLGLCCKEYTGCGYFLREQVRRDADADVREETRPV